MLRVLLPTVALLASFTTSPARAVEYNGICEASAGAFIDNTHFVVASDETNRLQLYERGNPKPIGDGIDMESFTSFDKSDLEGAQALADTLRRRCRLQQQARGPLRRQRRPSACQ